MLHLRHDNLPLVFVAVQPAACISYRFDFAYREYVGTR